MKKIFYFTVLLCFVFTLGAFSPTGKGKLIINIEDCKSDKGSVMIAIYDNSKNYLDEDKAILKRVVKVKAKRASLVLEDFPYGDYAMACFHDENENRKLDKNLVGIPKEGYAFSNNAKGTFGPPNFDKASFSFQKSNYEMKVNLSYW